MHDSNIRESLSNMITETSLEQCYQIFDSAIQRLKNYKKIFIYGAGGWGISLQKLLAVYSIDIHAFFDRRADEIGTINKIPAYNLDRYNATDHDKKDSLVIIAVKLEIQKSIADSLEKKGYINHTTINSLWHYGCWINKNELFSLVHEKGNILKCAEIWTDQKSLDIYFRQIECYLSRFYNIYNQIDKEQYFPVGIVFGKGYSEFVDCGAYTGDTIAALTKNIGKVNKLIAMEPDADNFKKLTSSMASEKENIANEICLYPCGVWSSSKMLTFDDTQSPSCHISESGHSYFQCLALDDVLINYVPSFVKMDIEGAEVEALKGACQTIKKHKPDLAISVYHRIEHLWEIPLLLKSLNNNYKFYLRSYDHFNQETVLYAV